MYLNDSFNQLKHKGFTLIETIIGIVVLSVSLSVITTLIYPVVEQSADQLHQIKAAELGQSMLNEIQNKAFDEKSDMAGGRIRCGELGIICTSKIGPEDGKDGRADDDEDTRDLFDDVDDYNNLTYTTGNIENSQGQTEPLSLYSGYALKISVCNDSDYSGPDCSGTPDTNISTAKLIIVTVTTPSGFDITFSTYRANF